MCRDTVDDIAEMAPFARQNGYMDRHAHGVATQGQRVADEQEDIMRGGSVSGRGWLGVRHY
ncbi:MAG: hypothetical protein A2V62_01260 [Nitrospirae bacterium RBG_19FT_COMBO_58_9]|nr:MAG: hypothetical protein A2V62_01260 [Nitrospirae bacterium RBG_19FT_COMBO_58_9]